MRQIYQNHLGNGLQIRSIVERMWHSYETVNADKTGRADSTDDHIMYCDLLDHEPVSASRVL